MQQSNIDTPIQGSLFFESVIEVYYVNSTIKLWHDDIVTKRAQIRIVSDDGAFISGINGVIGRKLIGF